MNISEADLIKLLRAAIKKMLDTVDRHTPHEWKCNCFICLSLSAMECSKAYEDNMAKKLAPKKKKEFSPMDDYDKEMAKQAAKPKKKKAKKAY